MNLRDMEALVALQFGYAAVKVCAEVAGVLNATIAPLLGQETEMNSVIFPAIPLQGFTIRKRDLPVDMFYMDFIYCKM